MLSIACDNRQKVTVTATPNGPLDGALRVTVQSGDGTVEQDPATPLSFKAVSGPTASQTVFLVEGDAQAGAGEAFISETVELTVAAAAATSLGMAAGVIELK
jgi:hypothetical protein